MLYFIRFDIHQPEDMDTKRLTEIWNEEATAAIRAIEAGAVKGLWKVAGQRTVLAVLDVPDSRTLDQVVSSLPIVQAMGGSVETEVLPVYPYTEFAEDLRPAAG